MEDIAELWLLILSIFKKWEIFSFLLQDKADLFDYIVFWNGSQSDMDALIHICLRNFYLLLFALVKKRLDNKTWVSK